VILTARTLRLILQRAILLPRLLHKGFRLASVMVAASGIRAALLPRCCKHLRFIVPVLCAANFIAALFLAPAL
jgi:hypothetical protein